VADIPKTEGDATVVPIVWPAQTDLPTIYANQLYVHHTNNEFILVFGELEMPIMVGSPAEKRETLKKLPHLSVRPVAKIAVSPPVMLAMAQVIQGNVERFMSRLEASQSADTEEGT
jgi:hypothetical protein